MSELVAERYRAYTSGMALKKAKTKKGKLLVDEDRNAVMVPSHAVEDVAFEGELTDGKAEFDAGDVAITRIAFFGGDALSESRTPRRST